MKSISDLIQTVHRLRAPGGCPWDRAQTHQSLRPFLIEEAYEALDVLDRVHTSEDLKNPKIKAPLIEELGDVLLQVLLHSEMASEVQAFQIQDVAHALNDKLIRRHPHVFGDTAAHSADVALQNWEKQKAKEKASKVDASALDGVPKGLPALLRAGRVIEKVTQVGFQWNDMHGPLEKVDEELSELKTEILKLDDKNLALDEKKEVIQKVEDELGDLFFTLCNLAYLTKINPEDALRGTLSRFEKRFKHVETRLKENGKTPDQSNLPEMDTYWDEAKKLEKVQVWGLTGGIASGKSTIGKFLQESGIPIIDADLITRDLLQERGAAHPLVVQRFGTADRKKLREMVFSDPQAKEDLEKILHPLIRQHTRKQILALSEKHKILVYEATLLVETGRYKDFHRLIAVEAPKEDRLKRLLSRPEMTLELAEQILANQATDEQRRKVADLVIENPGTSEKDLEELRRKAQELVLREFQLDRPINN